MLYIDGQWRMAQSEKMFDVFNPATGEWIGEVADGNQADTEAAIEAASRAFTSWSKTTAYERADLLYEAYHVMMERKEALAELMTKEQGKPIRAARNEVQYAADFLRWFAEEAKRIYGRSIPSARSDQRFLSIKQPIGLVAAITPWNYPISMLTRKLSPALAAGCTVVLKPAEETPLCAQETIRIFDDIGLPRGVLNLISTSDAEAVGDVFLSNRAVKKLTFTGSTEVGKRLASKAALQVKNVSMELGGHAPFIVFEDADPVYAAKGLSLVKFLNTGQACISPNRIFVHRSIIDRFTESLVERVRSLNAGYGLEEGVQIGPLVNEAAMEKVHGQVEDAVEKGAKLLIGGRPLREEGLEQGYFYAPTVLSGVTEEMRIYREETFGPVAAIIPFDCEESVIEMANDTDYGLAAYLYTNQLSRAIHCLEQLDFGIVGINDINPTSAAAPFGGMKESGLGREGAQEGIEAYLETKLAGFSI